MSSKKLDDKAKSAEKGVKEQVVDSAKDALDPKKIQKKASQALKKQFTDSVNPLASTATPGFNPLGGGIVKPGLTTAEPAGTLPSLKLPETGQVAGMIKNVVPTALGKNLPKSFGMSEAEFKDTVSRTKFQTGGLAQNASSSVLMKNARASGGVTPYGPSRATSGEKPQLPLPAIDNLALRGLHFVCQIDGLSLDTLSVTEFSQQEGLSQLFTLTVTGVSRQANIDIKSLLLKKVDFFVFVNGQPQRKISGVVASAKKGKTGVNRTFYTFIIRPHLWMLTLHQDSRIFHFKTVPEILEILLNEHGVQFDYKLFAKHEEREYTTQKRETNYDFFCRLAAEEGITHWLECDITGLPQVFFSDSRLGCTAGLNLVYNPHPQTLSTEKLLTDIESSATMMPGKMITKDYNYHNPKYDLTHEAKADDPLTTQEQFTVFESFGRFQTDAQGKPFTQYRLDALRAESELGRAEGNCIEVKPGQFFTLTAHPDAALNSTWQPVRVFHHGRLPQSMEEESDGMPAYLSNEIEFIAAQKEWRPPFIPKPTVDGAEVAVVVGPSGEEIFTNENGEIKIHFHWNRYDPMDERASCWVRVIQSWMGDSWGFVSIPRIGQEVVVSYLEGDIDRPIVSGGVYNAQNRPPLDLPAEKTRTSFKSKTHKGDGFNEMRFEDSNGQQEFFMHAQKDMNTKVLNDRTTTVMANHSENITLNQTTQVGKDQTTIVNQSRTVAIKQSQTMVAGETKTELINGPYVMSSSKGIRLVCGDSIIEMTAEGQISIACKNFNFYAEQTGQITAVDLLDLNMDGAKPGVEEKTPSIADINKAVNAIFVKAK